MIRRDFLDRHFPDTSRRGTRRDLRRPVTPRERIPTAVWFPLVTGRSVRAPEGYAFNHRGDLINLRKRGLA